MDLEKAREIILANTTQVFGNYYRPASSDEATGVGQIFNNVRYPVFNSEERLFETYEGYAYLLTHECDLSQENDRPFNKNALICPIIPFTQWLAHLSEYLNDEALVEQFLVNMVKEKISRVKFIPEITAENLPYGGVLEFNATSTTNIEMLESRITSLTNYSLKIMDIQLTNHLLRPKAIISHI